MPATCSPPTGDWAEARAREQETLARALALEEQAVAEIERALEAVPACA